MASLKAFGRLAKKETAGQEKISTPLRSQRGYAKGQLKAAGATGLTMAALSGMTIAELRKAKKEAQTEAERAKIQAAIEKTLRQMKENEGTTSKVNQSLRPRARPEGKAKGGAVKLKGGGTPAVASPTAKRIIPSSEPPWLTQMKKEAERLGIPLRELLTMHKNSGPKKPKAKGKKASMKAAKGGYSKKK